MLLFKNKAYSYIGKELENKKGVFNAPMHLKRLRYYRDLRAKIHEK